MSSGRARSCNSAAPRFRLSVSFSLLASDVIRLDTLGFPAVALCTNRISREQAAKAAKMARKLAGGAVRVLLDCDPEREEGMKQCVGYLAQLRPVRLAWMSRMYGGKFNERQPESLTAEEWGEIRSCLRTYRARDGS